MAVLPRYDAGMDRTEQELAVLEQISQILGSSLELEELFGEVMDVVAERLGMRRAALILKDESTGGLRMVAAIGLTPEEQARGQYAIGEGITGRVVATGESRVIEDVSRDPDFLDRTGVAGSLGEEHGSSFICVPVKMQRSVVGVISVFKPFEDRETLHADARLLSIISASLAQAIHINQLVKREKDQLLAENQRLRDDLRTKYTFSNIIGHSPAMMDVLATIGQVASSRATVLLQGETGVGKELIAKAIHYNSPRRDQPFVRVHCGSLSESLLESELFGHVRGSFTGAVRDKVGRFEAAHGGTIFLDEIDAIPVQLQVKLLRVLQERELERVGDHRTRPVDIRVIAASHAELQEEVRKGQFRDDLYYRLSVVTLFLPPLRSRREDIPMLIDHFLDKYNRENDRCLKKISRELMNILLKYPWPGNVRELENAIERAVVLSSGEEFTEDLLPMQIRMFAEQGRDKEAAETVESLAKRLAEQGLDAYELTAHHAGPRPDGRGQEPGRRLPGDQPEHTQQEGEGVRHPRARLSRRGRGDSVVIRRDRSRGSR